jgi:hypothetical protein
MESVPVVTVLKSRHGGRPMWSRWCMPVGPAVCWLLNGDTAHSYQFRTFPVVHCTF